MKNKSILFTAILAVFFLFSAFFLNQYLKFSPSKKASSNNGSQINLEHAVDSFVEMKDSLKKSVDLEKEKAETLKKQLEKVISENESLNKEFVKAKSDLDSTREKLVSAEKSLKEVNAKISSAEGNGQLRHTEDLVKELESLYNSETNPSPSVGASDSLDRAKSVLGRDSMEAVEKTISELRQSNSQLKQEIAKIKNAFEEANRDYADLKEEHLQALETIRKNSAELSRRAEKIASLQANIEEIQAKLSDLYSKYKQAEKDSALLREKYVLIQLEREQLKNQLSEQKAKLNAIQAKSADDSLADQSLQNPSSSKKIDVELIPLENGKNEK